MLRTPFLRENMECLSPSSPYSRVVYMKPAQIGGSDGGVLAVTDCNSSVGLRSIACAVPPDGRGGRMPHDVALGEDRWLSAAEARYRGGMGMTLNIPDSVLQGLRIPEGEIAQRLRTELAIALYAQGALSLGKAAELAETNRIVFGEIIGQRGIARHYGDAEWAQDVSYARSE